LVKVELVGMKGVAGKIGRLS